MEIKFLIFKNELHSIFGTHPFQFVKVDNESYCVRPVDTGMFCGIELKKMIFTCDTLGLNYYVSYRVLDNTIFVEFVIYK